MKLRKKYLLPVSLCLVGKTAKLRQILKMQEAMQHIKSYAEYVLREMCKTCETDEVSKRFNPPDADDRYPAAQVIGGEVTFN